MYNEYSKEREQDSKELKTPIFPILNSYIEQVIEIGTPIVWEPTKDKIQNALGRKLAKALL